MKNSFVTYANWATIIDNLPRQQAGELSQAICHYFLTGEVIEMDPVTNAIFLSIQPVMDEDNDKYNEKVNRMNENRENGITKKSERNHTDIRKKSERNHTDIILKSERNHTDIFSDNDNDNVSTNVDIYNVGQPDQTNKKSELKSDLSSGMTTDVTQIVDYLNEKTQSNFKAKTDNTKKAIIARLKEGYTVEDFKKVIDSKTNEWLNDSEMRSYLRPSTLFRPANFEAYLNEANRPRPTPKKEKPNPFNQFEQNSHDWDDLEKKLFANL